jgi:curved DNA-binding protein
LQPTELDHYATLGLDRHCTAAQIRTAYRLLAKQHHPDVNPSSTQAMAQTQALNAAYEILSNTAHRQTYDAQLAGQRKTPPRPAKSQSKLEQAVHLRIEEFLRGTSLQVRVNDPSQPGGSETYELIVPPETAPGTRFRMARTGGGFLNVKAGVRPDFRFKARGSDLRCDLRISSHRAKQGGLESIRNAAGAYLRVTIPAGVASGAVIRLTGEGLPKTRGGRGDLLVRIMYRPEVRITTKPRH